MGKRMNNNEEFSEREIKYFLDFFKNTNSYFSLKNRGNNGCFAYMIRKEEHPKPDEHYFALSGFDKNYNGQLISISESKKNAQKRLIDSIKKLDPSLKYCPLKDHAVASRRKAIQIGLCDENEPTEFVSLKRLYTINQSELSEKIGSLKNQFNCCERMLICSANDFNDFRSNYKCKIYVKYKPCDFDHRDCQGVIDSCASTTIYYLFKDSKEYQVFLDNSSELEFQRYISGE